MWPPRLENNLFLKVIGVNIPTLKKQTNTINPPLAPEKMKTKLIYLFNKFPENEVFSLDGSLVPEYTSYKNM